MGVQYGSALDCSCIRKKEKLNRHSSLLKVAGPLQAWAQQSAIRGGGSYLPAASWFGMKGQSCLSPTDPSFFFFVTLLTPLLPRDESVVSRDQPISPRYTPCILISRIGSALPHRVNSQQTNSVDYVVYSRSHAFHDGNQTTKEKPNAFGIEPSTFPS